MSNSIKTFVSFERFDYHKTGKKVSIYRKTTLELSKEEVIEARKHRENLRLNVT